MKGITKNEILGTLVATLIGAGVGAIADGVTSLGMRAIRKSAGVNNNDELADLIINKFEKKDEVVIDVENEELKEEES